MGGGGPLDSKIFKSEFLNRPKILDYLDGRKNVTHCQVRERKSARRVVRWKTKQERIATCQGELLNDNCGSAKKYEFSIGCQKCQQNPLKSATLDFFVSKPLKSAGRLKSAPRELVLDIVGVWFIEEQI